MGATVGNIVRLVMSRIAVLLVARTLTGLVLAVAASRPVVVYQSSAAEPRIMASVIGVFLVIAVVSCWSVRRSTAIEPTSALRLD